MHAPDVGNFVRIRSVFYVPAFLWSDGFAITATAQVKQTVRSTLLLPQRGPSRIYGYKFRPVMQG